jgi:hypothetical protein
VIKTLPSDGDFYLGRALQMSGNYTEAIESYNLFTKKAGKKAARVSGVAEFINQCNENKGALTETDLKPTEITDNIKVDSSAKVSKSDEKEVLLKPDEKNVSQENNLPVGYDKLMDQALEFQFFAEKRVGNTF